MVCFYPKAKKNSLTLFCVNNSVKTTKGLVLILKTSPALAVKNQMFKTILQSVLKSVTV